MLLRILRDNYDNAFSNTDDHLIEDNGNSHDHF